MDAAAVMGGPDSSLVVACAVGILAICGITKLIKLPIELMMKLVSNSVVGAFMLFVADFFGLGIEITILKALFAGICGIPGVLIIIIWEKFLAG